MRSPSFLALAAAFAAAAAYASPITEVAPDLAHLRKWNHSNGDTWDPFWADDGQLYAFNCDGRGFGAPGRGRGHNLSLNEFTGDDPAALTGWLVNPMSDYGRGGQKEPDNATWKICGQECIDGVFYGFVARNVYGKESKDPLLRQTSFNSSLIESTDHGETWRRSAAENYAHPMWPGGRFGSPGFIHYGQNGGRVTQDQADRYVYAISNNGFWNGGDNFILGRVPRAAIRELNVADWRYYAGGGLWTADIRAARPILDRPAKCGWTSPTYIAALHRYVLVSWYVTPTLKKWFKPERVQYDFFQAEHPWGPWTYVSTLDDRFLAGGHMYGPNICARFQEPVGGDVRVLLFTAGCPFDDVPTGLYKAWTIPLLLRVGPVARFRWIPIGDPAVERMGTTTRVRFTGTGFTILAEKSPTAGALAIALDGGTPVSVELAESDFARLAQIPVFSETDLAAGEHELTVTTSATAPAAIDGFRVFGD